MAQQGPCSIEGCERPRRSGGWCPLHYGRWYRHGDPLKTLRIIGDDIARLWSKIDKRGPNDCWPWISTLDKNKYGEMSIAGRMRKAHQLIYELLVGPIPEGMVLDHTCHNLDLSCNGGPTCLHRRCCNPDHLEAVTQRVNARRGRAGKPNRDKTHCKCGLPLSGSNLYVDKSSGSRRCKACIAAANRRYHAKRKAAIKP